MVHSDEFTETPVVRWRTDTEGTSFEDVWDVTGGSNGGGRMSPGTTATDIGRDKGDCAGRGPLLDTDPLPGSFFWSVHLFPPGR